MSIRPQVFALLVIAAAPAGAQSAAPPLKLDLPPDAAAAPAASAAAPAASAAATENRASTPATIPAASVPPLPAFVDDGAPRATPACDNRTYGQPQVHGSIGMGVVAGNRVSGNYQTGSVQVTKALGSCDDPTGFVGLSIDVGQGNFNHRRRGRR